MSKIVFNLKFILYNLQSHFTMCIVYLNKYSIKRRLIAFQCLKPFLYYFLFCKKNNPLVVPYLLYLLFYSFTLSSLLNSQFSILTPHSCFPVENKGLEPLTPCVQGRCSKPTELIPRVY